MMQTRAETISTASPPPWLHVAVAGLGVMLVSGRLAFSRKVAAGKA